MGAREYASTRNFEEQSMLGYASAFFIVALVAALLGFGGISAITAAIAQVIFLMFLMSEAITLLFHFLQARV